MLTPVLGDLGQFASDVVEELGYAGLVVVMAVEHVFPPIPSELVLPLAGYEVSRGTLTFPAALIASTAGSLIGASILYWIARGGGRPLLLRLRRLLRISAADIDRAERRFERHSWWVVVLGRMVPGVRSLVSVPPGLLRMPYWRYLGLTLVGSLAWNTLLIAVGQQLGTRWEEVSEVLGPLSRIVLIALIPLTVAWVWVYVRRRRAGGRAADA
jgi:membrane protein DedA with SNARE-associated domain